MGKTRTLPTGEIGIGLINAELRTTGERALAQADGRELAERPTGEIRMSHYHGKTAKEHFYHSEVVDLHAEYHGSNVQSPTFTVENAISGTWHFTGTASGSSGTGDSGTSYVYHVDYQLGSVGDGDNINIDTGSNIMVPTHTSYILLTNGSSDKVAFESWCDGTLVVEGLKDFGSAVTITIPNRFYDKAIYIDDYYKYKVAITTEKATVFSAEPTNATSWADSYQSSNGLNDYIFGKYRHIDEVHFAVQVVKGTPFNYNRRAVGKYGDNLEFIEKYNDKDYDYYKFIQRRP